MRLILAANLVSGAELCSLVEVAGVDGEAFGGVDVIDVTEVCNNGFFCEDDDGDEAPVGAVVVVCRLNQGRGIRGVR